ncbi:MAG: hypothetical protein RQ723_01270 [Desulfuromonadales bacterium]|nr:hypothetical protein [Desulfuromonadales bacterium]
MNIHWAKLTHRFPDEKQCLASFIAWQGAEVIAGVKPTNLINILDRELACGRNMSRLWEKHKTSVLKNRNVSALVLPKFDAFAKSRHARAGGYPEFFISLKRQDSRFHGNEQREQF